MTAKFRPTFTTAPHRVVCIDCQTTFSTATRLDAHRTCGASHDLCPVTYQDQMDTIDSHIGG